jgi:hypothetical protein
MEIWPIKRKTQETIDELVKQSMPSDAINIRQQVLEYVQTWKTVHPDTKEWIKRMNSA